MWAAPTERSAPAVRKGQRGAQTLRLAICRLAISAAFFLAGWWLRPDWLPRQPYYLGFLFTWPLGAAIALWLISGCPGFREACRDSRRWWLIGLFAFTLWMLFSPTWSRYPSVSFGAGHQFAVVALFAVVVLCAGPSARTLALALAFGLVAQSAVVIGQGLMQRPVGLQSLGEFEIRAGRRGLSIVRASGAELMRPYGLTIHPNVVGGYLVVGLLAQTGWLARREARAALWRWLARLAVGLVGVWALCFTFSRSAWGAFVGGMTLVALASWPRLRRGADRLDGLATGRVLVAAGAAALIAAAFVLAYSDFLWARAGAGGEETEQISIAARRLFGDMALQFWRDHPWRGQGAGTFPWHARDQIARGPLRGQLVAENVHSVPLLALSELGLVGFGLYYGTLGIGGALIWRKARDPFAIGLAAGGAALVAIGLLDHYPWTIFHFAALQWALFAAALGQALGQREVNPKQGAE